MRPKIMNPYFMVLFLLVMGCAAPEDEAPTVPGTREPDNTSNDQDLVIDDELEINSAEGVETPVTNSEPPVDEGNTNPQDDLITAVIADLSRRFNVDPGRVEVLENKEVTWADSSLGCPEPGVGYLTVLTPGRQIILGVDGKQYHYHAGRDNQFFYCRDPKPPVQLNPNQPPPPGADD
jgi:hypothetical protein